jgi:ABC-type cobalamin/Fe3+-siderophores transport system ATPase subunit
LRRETGLTGNNDNIGPAVGEILLICVFLKRIDHENPRASWRFSRIDARGKHSYTSLSFILLIAGRKIVALFEIQNLLFHYPSLPRFELNLGYLSIAKGDLVGFLGPNGAGKSTLLRLMAGLLAPRQGRVLFEGRTVRGIPARERAKKIAFVPQSIHFTFPLSVWEIVEMGRHPYLGRFEKMGRTDRAVCERALELCDALEFKNRIYDELSGGEKQRVLLASALAQTPQVLLLDEPTLSLDLSHQIRLFEIIQNLHREESLTVGVATHELNLAGRYLKKLVLMKGGQNVSTGTPRRVLTPGNIRKVHGVEVDKLAHRGDFPYFVPKKKKEGRP